MHLSLLTHCYNATVALHGYQNTPVTDTVWLKFEAYTLCLKKVFISQGYIATTLYSTMQIDISFNMLLDCQCYSICEQLIQWCDVNRPVNSAINITATWHPIVLYVITLMICLAGHLTSKTSWTYVILSTITELCNVIINSQQHFYTVHLN